MSENNETPKGRGRPKKGAKRAFNFNKRKLDFGDNEKTNSVDFRNKISVVNSDITQMKCDAIVNAAKTSLLGGGGIDGKIHQIAGLTLLQKCVALPVKETDNNGDDIRCHPGGCEVTDTIGTNLQAMCEYVFHTGVTKK